MDTRVFDGDRFKKQTSHQEITWMAKRIDSLREENDELRALLKSIVDEWNRPLRSDEGIEGLNAVITKAEDALKK